MARPRLHGLKQVPRKNANGIVVRVDWYHRATGKHVGTDEAEAKRRADELDGDVKAAPLPTSTFEGLAAAYLTSDAFRRLAAKAQGLNRLYVGKLVKRFANSNVADITRPVVVAFRESLSKEIAAAPRREPGEKKPWLKKGEEGPMTPTVAKGLVNKLCITLQHGVDLGVLPANPALKAKANFGVRPRKEVWEPEQIERFIEHAPPRLKVAAGLLFYTAQRPSDVMVMDWGTFVRKDDGKLWVDLIDQSKTGELVRVPVHKRLSVILRDAPTRSGLLVPSPKAGDEWEYRNFARAWDGAMKKAGLADLGLQRRDLRRTAMVRMAESGATDAQIAAVSGHSIEQTRRILDTYIPRRGEVAAGAIAAWEDMLDARDIRQAEQAHASALHQNIAAEVGLTPDQVARVLEIAGAHSAR
ncbi:tyrosine-type recombinase/integrase [Acidisphaera sp. S103]|uniref:tyrosine-type recombinase/integrase n=1 Tax=Acidisphaera sp. S103 TaxID=1747223 RepID=UPI00131E55EE|nr:tyrosine-type recombinase/integrase [Acidisphaera sp. S103]